MGSDNGQVKITVSDEGEGAGGLRAPLVQEVHQGTHRHRVPHERFRVACSSSMSSWRQTVTVGYAPNSPSGARFTITLPTGV
jgi:hypothetical protein